MSTRLSTGWQSVSSVTSEMEKLRHFSKSNIIIIRYRLPSNARQQTICTVLYVLYLHVKILWQVEQIQAEYKVRALQFHPDKNPDNPEAEAEFQKLQVRPEVIYSIVVSCQFLYTFLCYLWMGFIMFCFQMVCSWNVKEVCCFVDCQGHPVWPRAACQVWSLAEQRYWHQLWEVVWHEATHEHCKYSIQM